MSEMVERVARALFECDGPHWDSNAVTDDARDEWRARARAAIVAMREPTGAMLDAADHAGVAWADAPGDPEDRGGLRGWMWRAMIDAAASV